MRKLLITALIVTIPLIASAKHKPETIAELQARAAAADQKKQVDLYAKLAKKQLDAADDLYNTDTAEAKVLIAQAAQSADLAADAAIAKNHKLKKTEIRLREISHRMSDLRRDWAFEDRSAPEAAIKVVEAARTKLLNRMFRK